jgi:D-alanyl-D-alanine-carboxypeptidase/D-alanyl-D-alanine-endopeptidase
MEGFLRSFGTLSAAITGRLALHDMEMVFAVPLIGGCASVASNHSAQPAEGIVARRLVSESTRRRPESGSRSWTWSIGEATITLFGRAVARYRRRCPLFYQYVGNGALLCRLAVLPRNGIRSGLNCLWAHTAYSQAPTTRFTLHIAFATVVIALVTGCKPSTVEKPSPPPRVSVSSSEGLKRRCDAIVQNLIDDEWTQGLVVAFVTPTRSDVFSYGTLSVNDDRPPAADTIFEIGSLSKLFTALLLADLVVEGDVSLDAPIADFLPKGTNSPRSGQRPIRLVDLATHSSGMPIIPRNFWLPGVSIYDPNAAGQSWTAYSKDKLYAYLKWPVPPPSPPGRYLYSNLGYGLLGHLLELHSGRSYQELLTARICQPLGMHNTTVVLNDEQRSRLAPGHDADGNPTQPWETSVLAGAFAVRSTIDDLVLFARANLGLNDGQLARAIELAQRPHFNQSAQLKIGLGWNLNSNGVVYHTGATGGYVAAIFLLPRLGVGVVALANQQIGGGTDNRGRIFETVAGSLLNAMVGAPPIEVKLPKVAKVDASLWDDYVGRFVNNNGDKDWLEVTRQDGRLLLLIPKRIPRRLYPEGPDVFFAKEYDLRVRFVRNDNGVVTKCSGTLSDKIFNLVRDK